MPLMLLHAAMDIQHIYHGMSADWDTMLRLANVRSWHAHIYNSQLGYFAYIAIYR